MFQHPAIPIQNIVTVIILSKYSEVATNGIKLTATDAAIKQIQNVNRPLLDFILFIPPGFARLTQATRPLPTIPVGLTISITKSKKKVTATEIPALK